MLAILTRDKFIEALQSETSTDARLTQAKKIEMTDTVKSAIILCLGDKVLREVV